VPIDLNTPVALRDLAGALDLELRGDGETLVRSVASLRDAAPGSITFSREIAPPMPRGALLLGHLTTAGIGLVSNRARLDFARALTWLQRTIGFSVPELSGIDPTAIIHPTAIIADKVAVGPRTVIGAGAVIHDGTIIGADCTIRSSTVIGDSGFGFEPDERGVPIEFPQLSHVHLGDRVVIGTGNTVARGTLSPTIIQDDVKTDNLVHVAHNCNVGPGTIITACAELSGGVVTGQRVWIGPNASIMQKVTIGDGAIIGIGAVVLRDVAGSSTVAGNPARRLERK
jgi:UDP-3-O-[3-hydroxymyristoyl] glucosamine N-acyltransferase LpxD